DAASRERLALLMKKIQKKYRVTMLYVTHDHNEALYMGDQVLVIDQGRVVQMGKPEEIFSRPASRFVAHFTATRNILPGRITKRCGDGLVRVEVVGAELMSTSFPFRGEDVWVCLRPEHFTLASDLSEASNKVYSENSVSGYRISQIIPQSGVTVLLELMRQNERLLIFVSSREIEQQGLCVDSYLKLNVDAAKVHCLPRQPEDIFRRPESLVQQSAPAE
ncbi:hypothetical protein KAI46_07485, partial [bacterium]|nr:hypothetical protein [bacterium]